MRISHSKLSKNEPACMCKEAWCVGLGQEGRDSCNQFYCPFLLFHFMKNGHKIILKFKWVSGSAVSLALAGSRRSPSWCSGGQNPRKNSTFSYREV